MLFDHCQFGARVPPRQSDSPMLPKHFQCRTQLLTKGPAFKALGLLCRREHEHGQESSPVGSDFLFPSQVAGVCKSGSSFPASSQYAAAWLAGGQLEALDRASPCRRRGTQSWPGAPRAHGQIGDSWARPSFGMTSSRRLQVRMGIKLETLRAYFAPRGLRSLDDCFAVGPKT